MIRREVREFISPLLQPPLNKLFVPRPTPEYLPPINKNFHERKWLQVEPTCHYIHLLSEDNSEAPTYKVKKIPPTRKERIAQKRRTVREAHEVQVINCTSSSYIYLGPL